MLAALALWVAQAVAMEIVGEGSCPSPMAVRRELEALSPPNPTGGGASAGPAGVNLASGQSVRLSRGATGPLQLVLVGSDGGALAERTLAAGPDCDELASAAAVVIATWSAELDPSLPARVDLPRPPARAATTETAPSLVVEAAAPSRAGGPPLAEPPSRLLLRVGALASSAGGNWAAGALASGWLALWEDHMGLGAALGATMPRAESVGSAVEAARWTRGYFAAGPGVSLLAGDVAVNAHLHGAIALLHVAGSGLETNTSETAVQFGGVAGASLTWRRWRAARPWVGADLLAWPSREHLRVVGLAERTTLPRLEVHLVVGLEFGLFQ